MEITLDQLRANCINNKQEFNIGINGSMWMGRVPVSTKELREIVGAGSPVVTSRIIKAPTSAPDFLEVAAGHMRDRAATYDKEAGERSMAQTVNVFNAFHGTQLTEAQGWHLMQILKDVRLFTRPAFHQDSAEDGVAYSALKAEAKARERPTHANDNTPQHEALTRR